MKRPILHLKSLGDPKTATGTWLDRELKRGEDAMKARIRKKEREDG